MDRKKLITWAIIIGVILIILYAIYRWGKRNAEGPQVEYPNGGEGIPAGWSPVPLIDELHDSMSGIFDSASSKENAWLKMFQLPTDDMVVAVYDGFNQKYFREGDGTLVQWIKDEWNYGPAVLGGVREQLLDRLSQLQLP